MYKNGDAKEFTFDPVDQYMLQARAFAHSILNNTPVPTPLSDALKNMQVIDAFRESAGNKW